MSLLLDQWQKSSFRVTKVGRSTSHQLIHRALCEGRWGRRLRAGSVLNQYSFTQFCLSARFRMSATKTVLVDIAGPRIQYCASLAVRTFKSDRIL